MRRRNQRFPQSSCIGIMMKLRSACGAAPFCVPASPHAVANATAKRAALSTRFAPRRGAGFPRQALRLASLRGEPSGLCLRVPPDCPEVRGNVESCRAAHALASVFALPYLACASASRTGPFYFRACPRLRLTSAPQFADKKRQLVAELPWHSLMRRKIASKKILRTQ